MSETFQVTLVAKVSEHAQEPPVITPFGRYRWSGMILVVLDRKKKN